MLSGHGVRTEKSLEVALVERVDSLQAIGLHARDDLQIEDIATRYGTTAKQAHPAFNRLCRNRQDMEKGNLPCDCA